jgi:hypothetical protein
MCLICEEEDLYFLYLERLERARKAARGEAAPPNANWLWPTLAPSAPAKAAEGAKPGGESPRFTCDAPE